MLPGTILASGDDFPWSKIITAVMFLIVWFVQWIIKLGRQKLEEVSRAKKTPLTDDEKEMRRRALERHLAPPPLPQPTASAQRVSAPSSTAAPAAVVPHPLTLKKPPHPLLKILATGDATRQAIVLKEVLGTPKALQTPDDALF